jgi:protoheme IX farnesyltransferase
VNTESKPLNANELVDNINPEKNLAATSFFKQPRFFKQLAAYYQLTKPTIVLLVVVTTIPTLFLPTNVNISSILVVATLLGTYFAAASASIFNHLVESDLDRLMARTRLRPVASGRVSKPVAFILASAMALASFGVLAIFVNNLSASIALGGIFFYVVIYTLILKPRTPQNIVIGGAAGAVGPLIGWAAVTGTLEWPAWVLFALIFFWTPPHFWALALKYKKDYEAAGIPMYPVVYGDERTRRVIFLYSLLLLPLVLSLYFGGIAGNFYLFISTLTTVYFIYLAFQLYREHSNQKAMPLFLYSCVYLFIIFGALAFEKFLVALA